MYFGAIYDNITYFGFNRTVNNNELINTLINNFASGTSTSVTTTTSPIIPSTSTTPTTTPTTTPSTTPSTTTSPTISISFENVTINIKPGWNLLSSPTATGGSSGSELSTIYSQLQNNCGLSSSEKLWGYNGTSGMYIWINGPGSAIGTFQSYEEYYMAAGSVNGINGNNGYWFYSTKQCSVTTQGILASSAPAGTSFKTALSTGWNLIGVPLIENNSFSTIASSCNLRGGFYGYDPTTNSYTNTTMSTVGKGYFVFANSPCMLDWTPNNGNGSPPPSPTS